MQVSPILLNCIHEKKCQYCCLEKWSLQIWSIYKEKRFQMLVLSVFDFTTSPLQKSLFQAKLETFPDRFLAFLAIRVA